MQNNSLDKLILIILDGCRYDTAIDQLGFLNHLVDHDLGKLVKVQSEMPSNSRPLYEVLMTGVPTYQTKIYSNFSVMRSKQTSIFDLVTAYGGKTGAATYAWFSELYNQAPYNIKTDRIQNDPEKLIQHGIFYNEDSYPDSHLFADANYLVQEYAPDFLVVHSMNIDDIGHKYTAVSREYQQVVNRVDIILAEVLPDWLEQGYQVVVTADHGMDEFGLHGGSLEAHRAVPCYLFTEKRNQITAKEIKQLDLAPLLCFFLGLAPAKEMNEINHIIKE
ncbi:alkaline phosphatase family protein [Enterococcus sp. DIV1444a]|uniref:alkaline phosphatase family protein n=1 Tax=Enterococcus sp. DIV1444a TaxID=2774679 RepID=UPI003F25E9C1